MQVRHRGDGGERLQVRDAEVLADAEHAEILEPRRRGDRRDRPRGVDRELEGQVRQVREVRPGQNGGGPFVQLSADEQGPQLPDVG